MRLTLSLEPDQSAPARARTSLRALTLGLPGQALGDLQLVVSELVTNAVARGPGERIRVDVALDDDGGVRGEVCDGGAAPTREQPLGLRLVDGLTRRWGVAPATAHVWFEL